MHLKIITHENIIFDEDVNEIYSKGLDGEFGILKGHEPIMSALDIGVTRIVQDNDTKLFTTMGGIFQFKDDEAVILTDAGEFGGDIDVARAKEAKAYCPTVPAVEKLAVKSFKFVLLVFKLLANLLKSRFPVLAL